MGQLAMWPGSISPKAGKKLKSGLSVLRGTRAQKTKMAPMESKAHAVGKAEVPAGEINAAANQRKGSVGTVSKGGIVGRTGQFHTNEINKPANKKAWPVK